MDSERTVAKQRFSFRSSRQAVGELLFACLTLLLAAILVYFGGIGWPGLHWDASLFATPVINVATGKGWVFGSHTPAIVGLPDLAYDFHGLLHVIVYGVLLKAGTWSQFMFLQGMINALTFLIYTAIYAVLLCRCERPGLKPLATSVVLGSIPAVICLGLQGRPEQLAPLILAIPLVTFLFFSGKFTRLASLGLCLGLLATLSPLAGIIFYTFCIGYCYVWNQAKFWPFIHDLAICGLLGAVVCLALVSTATPFSLAEWIANVRSGNGGSGPSFEGILLRPVARKWGETFAAPAWSLAVLLLTAIGFLRVWRIRGFRFLVMLMLVPSALYINAKACDYTYMSFLPFSIALCLESSSSPWKAETNSHRKVGTFQLVLVGFGLLYFYVLANFFLIIITAPWSQLSMRAAIDSFQSTPAWRDLQREPIAIGFPETQSPSLVFLGNADKKFVSFSPELMEGSSRMSLAGYERALGLRVRYYVLPQQYSLQSPYPPNEIAVGGKRFALQQSTWTGARTQLADKLSWPQSHGKRYSYAIYKREGS